MAHELLPEENLRYDSLPTLPEKYSLNKALCYVIPFTVAASAFFCMNDTIPYVDPCSSKNNKVLCVGDVDGGKLDYLKYPTIDTVANPRMAETYETKGNIILNELADSTKQDLVDVQVFPRTNTMTFSYKNKWHRVSLDDWQNYLSN